MFSLSNFCELFGKFFYNHFKEIPPHYLLLYMPLHYWRLAVSSPYESPLFSNSKNLQLICLPIKIHKLSSVVQLSKTDAAFAPNSLLLVHERDIKVGLVRTVDYFRYTC